MAELINYDVTEAVIEVLKAKLVTTIPSGVVMTVANIPALKEAKKEPAALRIAIEKKRVEYNEEAQKHIKNVNKKAKEAQALVNPIEEAYAKEIKRIEDEAEAERERLEQLEFTRKLTIRTRINDILSFARIPGDYTSREMKDNLDQLNKWLAETADFKYDEFQEEASKCIQDVFNTLDVKMSQRIELELLRKNAAELEAQRMQFEAEKAAFEAERALTNKIIVEPSFEPAPVTTLTQSIIIDDEPENFSLFPCAPLPVPPIESAAPWGVSKAIGARDIRDVIMEIGEIATDLNHSLLFELANEGIELLNKGK